MTVAALSITPFGVESYAHRAAKDVVAGWLRAEAESVGYDGWADWAGISWRVNRKGLSWGIWQELPIVSTGLGVNPVWDEFRPLSWHEKPPTYDEVVALGYRPMCVVDIAIQHKGRIAFVIEIKHKHGCAPDRLRFLRELDVEVIELPTSWVLGQVATPTDIPREFFLYTSAT